MSATLEPETEETELPVTADVATDGDEELDGPTLLAALSADTDDEPEPEPEAEAPDADVSAEAEPVAETPVAEAAPEPEAPAEPVAIEYDRDGAVGSYTFRDTHFDLTNNALQFKTPQAAQRMHTVLGHGVWYEAVGRKKMETLEKRLATEVPAAKAEAQELFDAFIDAATTLPEDQYIQRMLDFRAGAPEMRTQMLLAERDRRIAELEGRNKSASFDAPPEEHLTEWAESQVTDLIDADAASGSYAWMTPDCIADMKATLAHPEEVRRFLKVADEKTDPRAGLMIGQPYFDRQAFYKAARPIANAWKKAHDVKQEATANAARHLQTLGQKAKQNAKNLAQVKPAAKAPAIAPPPPVTREALEARVTQGFEEMVRPRTARPA